MAGWLIVAFLGWICGHVGQSYLKEHLLASVADRQTGEDRRKKVPVGQRPLGKPDPPLLEKDWEGKHVDVGEGFFTLQNEEKMYWCTFVPKDVKTVERVLLYVHGYTGSTAWVEFNAMATFAKLGNCAVIGVDLPGHGRSDGLHVYIEGWHPMVGCCMQFVEKFCTAKQQEWSEQSGRPLKLFAAGESMGGGVLTTLCLKKPNLFAGAILLSPMIAVAKQAMPHPLVIWIFKHIICALLPQWPIAPAKDLTDMCCTDKDAVEVLRANPFGNGHTAPKLRTGYVLAFEAPGWLEPRLSKLTVPLLVLHAAADRVTDPELSKLLHQEAKSEDKTLKLYEGAQHADLLHGGPGQSNLIRRVYDDIFEWLNARS